MKIKHLLYTAALLVACSSANQSAPNNQETTVDGERISVRVGESFQISLPSNPSTGYMWAWSNGGDVSFVDTINTAYEPKLPMLTGSGGTEKWNFEGLAVGTDTLKLSYIRPWTPDDKADSRTFIVEVKE